MSTPIVKGPRGMLWAATAALSLTPLSAWADPPGNPTPAGDTPPPPPAPQQAVHRVVHDSEGTSRQTVAFAAAGVAVAGATAAAIFGGLALENKHDFQASPSYARSDNGNNDAAYCDGGIALAVAAGVTSLVLFLTHDSSGDRSGLTPPKPAASFSASPIVTPHGGGAGALLRF